MKLKDLLKLALFTILVTVFGGLTKYIVALDLSWVDLLIIPLFLMVVEGAVLVIYSYVSKRISNRVVSLFGLMKVAKILASLLFIVVRFRIGEASNTFLIAFLVYYLLYMLYDSWMLIQIGKSEEENNKI